MAGNGKIYDTNPSAAPGKAKFQGGGSTGKAATLNKGGRETPMTKSVGTPKDKSLNR